MKQLFEDLKALFWLGMFAFFLFCLFSCSTNKKSHLEETYAKKTELQSLSQSVITSNKSTKNEITKSLISLIEQKLKLEHFLIQESEIRQNNKIDNLTVEFEPKFDSLGNLVDTYYKDANNLIETKGAKVIVTSVNESSESKESSAEFESKIEFLETSYYELFQISEELKKQNQKFNLQLINQKSKIEELKKSKSKKKTIWSLPFMLWVIIGGVLAFSIGLNWLNRFTILGKIKKIKSNLNPYI